MRLLSFLPASLFGAALRLWGFRAFLAWAVFLLTRLVLLGHAMAIRLVDEAYATQTLDHSSESSKQDIESGEKFLIKLLLEKAKSNAQTSPDNVTATLLALDYANYPQKDAKNAYDNILSLTPTGNYVMPIGDILSNLKKSANQKQISQR